MNKVAIVGPGAVAGVMAWHLAGSDCELSLVARPATTAAIERDGLSVIGGGADPQPRRIAVTANANALGPQDLVLVGFKAHDWLSGLHAVLPLIGPQTIVVPMLNGVPWWYFQGLGGANESRIVRSVDPDGELMRRIPQAQLLGCVIYVAAERETPARIRWNGRKRLQIGEPGGSVGDRVGQVVGFLRSAGIDAEASADIRHDIWEKLLGNVSYNPLSAVAGATMGRMNSHPPLREILRAMMSEGIAVASGLGVGGTFDVEKRLLIRPEMADVKTSMLQDLEAGRPLELAGIVEAVVELGRLAGVRTPMIEAIGALAAERERQSRLKA